VYVTLFMCSAQTFIFGQVVTSLCPAGAVPGSAGPEAGAQQHVTGAPVPPVGSWARQLLCLSMLGPTAGGYLVRLQGHPILQLLRPLASIFLQALDHVLVSVAPACC
jgi:hypothetical protein